MKRKQTHAPWTAIAEVELTYKSRVRTSERPSVSNSRESFEVFLQVWQAGRIELLEEFKVMLLNRANKVLGIFNHSQGGITGTVVDTRLICAAALKGNAVSLILAHNHPSGNLKPSTADEELTRKIQEAARQFDIKVLDHLIISPDRYFSFADEGLI